jgi:hypothetical protein
VSREKDVRRLLFALLASTAIPTYGWALEPSGSAVSVATRADAAGPGGTRTLTAPGDVFQGDVISTSPRGQAQIRFVDDTRFVVGPNSRVAIDDFVFKPDHTATDVSLNAVKGTFRFISGRSPHEVYSVNTPTMTIGVRGTLLNLRVLVSGYSYVNFGEGSGQVCVVPQGAAANLPRTECRDVNTGETAAAAPGGGFADFRPGELHQLLTVLSRSLGPVGPSFGPNLPPGPSGDMKENEKSSSY